MLSSTHMPPQPPPPPWSEQPRSFTTTDWHRTYRCCKPNPWSIFEVESSKCISRRFAIAAACLMPKHTRRWVDLDGLRILRRLEFLTEHTIDDGGMIDLWAPVAVSAVEFEHPDSHPYHPIRNVDAEQDLFDLSCITELTRYNSRGAYAAAISDDLALQSVTDRMLEAHCHMHRRSFDFIFSLIRDHSCFEIDSVKGGRPQISPRWQLFVALSRFVDSEGTTRSFSSHFKISKGTVIAVSLRVCSAITSVERRFL